MLTIWRACMRPCMVVVVIRHCAARTLCLSFDTVHVCNIPHNQSRFCIHSDTLHAWHILRLQFYRDCSVVMSSATSNIGVKASSTGIQYIGDCRPPMQLYKIHVSRQCYPKDFCFGRPAVGRLMLDRKQCYPSIVMASGCNRELLSCKPCWGLD